MSISHRSDKENQTLANGYTSLGDIVSQRQTQDTVSGNNSSRDALKNTSVSSLIDKALKQRINSNNWEKIDQTSSYGGYNKCEDNIKIIEATSEEKSPSGEASIFTLNTSQQNICNKGIETKKGRDLVIHSSQITLATNSILEELINQKSKADLQESYCCNNLAQAQSNQSSFRLHNADIIQDSSLLETSLSTSRDLSRKRRSRNERTKQRENIELEQPKTGRSEFELKILEVPCSPGYSNHKDQTQDQKMKVDYLQPSTRHESGIMTDRSNKRQINLPTAYRSIQERPAAKSCENRAKTHREFSNPRDPKLESVFSLENSMRQIGSQTYRGSSNSRKTSKQGTNQSVCLSSRVTDRSANTRRESNFNGPKTERGLITESLKAGYSDLAKISKEKNKICRKNEKSADKENQKNPSEMRRRDKNVFEVFGDKALQIRNSNVNIPLSQRGNNSETYKYNADQKPQRIDQPKQVANDQNRNKIDKSINGKEVEQKVMKFPNAKTCLESTYYEEFMRKKKLNEKLLQPRHKNYETIPKENIENLPKPKTVQKTDIKDPFSTNPVQFEAGSYSERSHHKMEENPLKTSNSNVKANAENENYFSMKKTLQESKQNKPENKEQEMSITMTSMSINKHQDKQNVPRIDRVADKTIIEKTYMEKNHLKNKGFAQKPMIKIKTGQIRKESGEKLIEFEQSHADSQTDSLSYREERSAYETNPKEENLWQQILDNAIHQINFDNVTQEWKKLTDNHLPSKQEVANVFVKDTETQKVEDKSDSIEVEEKIILKESPEKVKETEFKITEEKVIIDNNQPKEEFDIPIIEIRRLEERAAKIIQDFYRTKFHKENKVETGMVAERHDNAAKDDKPLIEVFSKYEILYRKINTALNQHHLEHSKDELALAFSTAYSFLKDGSFSAGQIYDVVKGGLNNKE